jgi:hypothetical protein
MSNKINSKAIDIMTKIGNIVAEEARRRTKTKRMASAITLGKAQQLPSGEIAIDLIIDLKKAPEFMAYEKGSGLYGKKAATYRIEPDKASVLAFPFTFSAYVGDKFLGGYDEGGSYISNAALNMELSTGDGIGAGIGVRPGFWKYVDHPGVEKEPAVIPAFVAKKEEAKDLFKGVMKAFNLEIKEATKSNA